MKSTKFLLGVIGSALILLSVSSFDFPLSVNSLSLIPRHRSSSNQHFIIQNNTISNICAIHMTGNWGFNSWRIYDPPSEHFDWLKSIHADWVGVSVALSVDDSMDSTVERVYEGLGILTFTDEALRGLFQVLRQNGFHIYFTLAFESLGERGDPDKPVARWQLGDPNMANEDPNINPEYWPWRLDHPQHASFVSEFWQTYTEQAVHFASLAEEEGVELFSLGTETERLFRSRKVGDWPNDFGQELQDMVTAVRSVYSGMLTYDMHYDALIASDFYAPSAYLWEDLDLDVVGVSAYFPLTDTPPTSVMSVESLETAWEQIFQNYLITLKNNNPSRPILFLEFGYVDSIESPNNPPAHNFEWRVFMDKNFNGLDDGAETQENICTAFFNIKDAYSGIVEGAFFWEHYLSTDEDWANYYGKMRTFAVRQKLAEDVVRNYYGKYHTYTLTTQVNPGEGGTITISPDKAEYNYQENVQLTATANAGYIFNGWTGDVPEGQENDNPINITMDLDKSLTANFIQQFTLIITSGTGGTTDPAPGTYTYNDGDEVSIDAIPDPNYRFTEWTGDVPQENKNDDPITITIDSDKSIEANFIRQYTLTISSGTGGTTDPSPDTYIYDSGSEVSIEATPSTGYRFAGWTGDVPSGHENDNPISITMDTDKSITATFIQQYTLTISAGTGGTTDPAPGAYSHDAGEQVNITAIPDSGYEFSGWSGDASGTANPTTVTMNSDKSVTASFRKKKGCFITEVFGSSMFAHVRILQDFRDTFLMPTKFGRAFVVLYYKISPSILGIIIKHRALKIAVRISLMPLVAFSYTAIHIGPIITTIMLILIFAFLIFLKVTYQRKTKRRVQVKD